MAQCLFHFVHIPKKVCQKICQFVALELFGKVSLINGLGPYILPSVNMVLPLKIGQLGVLENHLVFSYHSVFKSSEQLKKSCGLANQPLTDFRTTACH